MTTAHRPTWAPAKGHEEQGGMRIYAPSRMQSVKDLPGQTKLKFRQPGQNTEDELRAGDMRSKLEEKERKHFLKTKSTNFEEEREEDLRLLESAAAAAGDGGGGGAPRTLVPKAVDADDEDDADDSDSSDDDDEDDEAELLAELERIKRERAEEAARKAAEAAARAEAEEQAELVRGNPLLQEKLAAQDPSFALKRRWDDDVVFKNQTRGEPKAQKRFINDTIRNDFHRRFLERYRSRCIVMAASSLYLGLDVGTQGTKALLWEKETGEVLGRGSVGYSLTSSRPGQAEQQPHTWVEACKEAIADALDDAASMGTRGDAVDSRPGRQSVAARVKAVAVSGQQHGLVALDKDHKVIRPAKLWCDVESAEEAAELSQLFGFTLVPSFTATKLLWLKRREPQNWERLAHVLLPHDYINFWLTGRLCMEASDASGTGLFDAVSRGWDAERIRQLDEHLDSCLPPIIGASEVVGTLRPEVAAELGLPPEVVVAPGGGDNAMAALGSGAVWEGTWILSLGTSGTLFGPSSKPVLDPSGTICPFADATGAWLPLLCTLNCTGVTEEVRLTVGKCLDHDSMTNEASVEPPGCHGVTFLPFINGERTPNWPQATGSVLGLRPGLMRPGLLYRAAMEGATFTLLAGMQRMKDYGLAATELRVVGGGSQNRLWRRIVADAFQLPLRFPAEPEAAALGAALQAAAVHTGTPIADFVEAHPPPLEPGVLQPQHTTAAAYDEAFRRHQRWGACLFGGGSCEV
ncbi:Xylulokinase [Chlorella sorokiniana]|uniref:Xylulokinase n=1 Tax=Chlorella sorokiniana TaxID=3076 RepID=A0A2P6TI89_CHLSO|nr:Xylulokinase [Chlorella sorokiniana]|eukprot:PRW34012.1 Xylulokinase [Chlorella sorokiniana]